MSEKFQKPNIPFTPKKINAEGFGIPPYFAEEIIEGQPTTEFDDAKPFEEVIVRDKYPEEERLVIDGYIEDMTEIKSDLNDIDKELHTILDPISVNFEPTKYPLLNEACTCPNCAKGTSGVMTFAGAMAAKRVSEKGEEDYLSYADTNKSPDEILAEREENFRKIMAEMAEAVWNQIVIWVLEFLYSLLRFLKPIPYAKKIPKALKDEINRRKKQKSFRESVYDIDDQVIKYSGTNNSKQIFGGTVGDATKCMQHYNIFRETGRELIRNEDPNLLIYWDMLEVFEAQDYDFNNVHELLSNAVADDYTTPSGIKWINTAKKQYKPKPGERKTKDLEHKNGAIKAWIKTKKAYLKKMKELFNNWQRHKDMICCFIYNMTTILPKYRSTKDLQKIIEYIKVALAVLQLYNILTTMEIEKKKKNYSFDILHKIANALVHSVIQVYIGLLTGYVRDGIGFWMLRVNKIKQRNKDDRALRQCVPFDDFLLLFPDFIEDLLSRLNAYLRSFWDNSTEIPKGGENLVEIALRSLQITSWMKFFNDIIRYLKFWHECAEGDYSNIDMSDIEGLVDNMFSPDVDSLQKAKGESTIHRKAPIQYDRLDVTDPKELLESTKEPEHAGPWTYGGLHVLLTNFAGVPEGMVDEALSEGAAGECKCKGGFNPEEIQELQGLFNA